MRTFRVYRPAPAEGYVDGGFAVKAEEVQFEGVVFDDGAVAIRWFTLSHSTALWPSLDELQQIHGHPEYGTRWEWDDDEHSPRLEAEARVERLEARVSELEGAVRESLDAKDDAMRHPVTESKIRTSLDADNRLRCVLGAALETGGEG